MKLLTELSKKRRIFETIADQFADVVKRYKVRVLVTVLVGDTISPATDGAPVFAICIIRTKL